MMTIGWDTLEAARLAHRWMLIPKGERGDRGDIIAFGVIEGKAYFLLHNLAQNPPYYIGRGVTDER